MQDIVDRLNAGLALRYRVESELGQGGMAIVYLAQDLQHQRPVAIKVLRPEIGQEVGAERFIHEIQMAAGLTHPHILPLYASGEADGLLYYVMPSMKGNSLRDRMNREGQLPLAEQ
jgi:serine/threonine-protein kinase